MPNSPPLQLSIVIPCFDERNRLPPTLAAAIRYLDEKQLSGEVVVVDDGSRDGTPDWVREEAGRDGRIRLISYQPNRGKGYAVKTGLGAAGGEVVLFMDADGSTPIAEIEPLWQVLKQGQTDVVVGSRALKAARILAAQSPLRRMAGDLFGWLARVLVANGVADTQCGFKLFTRASAGAIASRLTVASAIFDVELLLIAKKEGFRIAEIPVMWKHDEDTRIAYNFQKAVRVLVELLGLKLRYGILWPVKLK